MALTFRQRVFLGLVGLGTLPLAGALAVLALEIRGAGSAAGPARAALDEIAASGRRVIAAVDTTLLAPPARAALRAHAESIAQRTQLARRAELLSRTRTGLLVGLMLLIAVALVLGSLTLARRWTRYASAPIEELVQWVHHIEKREPLPASATNGGPLEFNSLREALRDMAQALEVARSRELERGRLEAFRETARHLAHEMRGPLSAARLALRRFEGQEGAPSKTVAAIEVLEQETARLDQLAREFAEFGRLPEGPSAPVDIGELLESVATATVPGEAALQKIPRGLTVQGHYEPLRRAFQNLVKNAVEAGGPIEMVATREAGMIRVAIADGGPGVPLENRERVFEPYFTTKAAGTGLGLALVRQTVTAHGGTVMIEAAPGGGARFVVNLPVSA